MDNISTALDRRIVPSNGINLHVVYAGPQDGKPVILLHGFPEFWYGWRHQITPLAEAGFRVIIPDQRGYNLSDKPEGVNAYRIDNLVRDIVGLIDDDGHEEAFIIGHDWGAAVAWHMATHYPERVEKLGILNVPHPTVMVQTLRSSLTQLLKSWYIFFFQIPRLPEWGLRRNNAQGMMDLLRRSGKVDTFSEEELDRYRDAWQQPGALKAMINWYRAAFRSGIGIGLKPSSDTPTIHLPTLILWGKNDVALSYEMAEKSLELCEQGELITFENATHWVQHDAAAEVNDHLLAFLKS